MPCFLKYEYKECVWLKQYLFVADIDAENYNVEVIVQVGFSEGHFL